MNYGDNYFQTLLKQAIKQGLLEFLSENGLAMLSTKGSGSEAMISTNEAIKLLGGINRQTLYKYIAQGLPAYLNGKSYKFRVNDINDFINKNNRKK
jgi:hypothetical protein